MSYISKSFWHCSSIVHQKVVEADSFPFIKASFDSNTQVDRYKGEFINTAKIHVFFNNLDLKKEIKDWH